jgi:mRNA-degrading endonuclease RelE of RelBE toxin-antitoxin system
MSWKLDFSSQADKFLQKNPAQKDRLIKALSDFIKKISGEAISLDVKTMKGVWKGCHRIRKGDIRIIFSVNKPLQTIHVYLVDHRGDVYK